MPFQFFIPSVAPVGLWCVPIGMLIILSALRNGSSTGHVLGTWPRRSTSRNRGSSGRITSAPAARHCNQGGQRHPSLCSPVHSAPPPCWLTQRPHRCKALIAATSLKCQLRHVGSLAVHGDGDNLLAAALERGGQRDIHLVETRIRALRAGIQDLRVEVADLYADCSAGSAANTGSIKDQVWGCGQVDWRQRAGAGSRALKGIGVSAAIGHLRRGGALAGGVSGI